MIEPNYLVCKSAQEQGFIATGAFPMPCTGCGKTVWVTPQGLIFLGRMRGCQVLCTGCGTRPQPLFPYPVPTLGINPLKNKELNRE